MLPLKCQWLVAFAHGTLICCPDLDLLGTANFLIFHMHPIKDQMQFINTLRWIRTDLAVSTCLSLLCARTRENIHACIHRSDGWYLETSLQQSLSGQKKQEPSNNQTGCQQTISLTRFTVVELLLQSLVMSIHCSLMPEWTIYRFLFLGLSLCLFPWWEWFGNDYWGFGGSGGNVWQQFYRSRLFYSVSWRSPVESWVRVC